MIKWKLLSAIALAVMPGTLWAQDMDSLIRSARSIVAARLVDPDSLVFRNTQEKEATSPTGESVTILCGEYNARNGFGGYSGYRTFIYEGTSMKGVISVSRSLEFMSQDGSSDYSAEAASLPGIDLALLSARLEEIATFLQAYLPVCQQRT